MILLALGLVLAAAEPAELKLAAPGLTTSGLDAAMSAPLTDHLAQAFTGIRVVTARDISVLLGFERQKQLLGCSDDGMCMAELGNALGVQGVLSRCLSRLARTRCRYPRRWTAARLRALP